MDARFIIIVRQCDPIVSHILAVMINHILFLYTLVYVHVRFWKEKSLIQNCTKMLRIGASFASHPECCSFPNDVFENVFCLTQN